MFDVKQNQLTHVVGRGQMGALGMPPDSGPPSRRTLAEPSTFRTIWSNQFQLVFTTLIAGVGDPGAVGAPSSAAFGGMAGVGQIAWDAITQWNGEHIAVRLGHDFTSGGSRSNLNQVRGGIDPPWGESWSCTAQCDVDGFNIIVVLQNFELRTFAEDDSPRAGGWFSKVIQVRGIPKGVVIVVQAKEAKPVVRGVVREKMDLAVVPHGRGVGAGECGQAGGRCSITHPKVGGHPTSIPLPASVVSRPWGVNELPRTVDVGPGAIRDRKLLEGSTFGTDRKDLGALRVPLDAAGKEQHLAFWCPSTQGFSGGVVRESDGDAAAGGHGPEVVTITKVSLEREHLAVRRKSRTVGPSGCLHQWCGRATRSGRRPNATGMGEGDLGFGEIRPGQQTGMGGILTKGKGGHQQGNVHAINVDGELGVSSSEPKVPAVPSGAPRGRICPHGFSWIDICRCGGGYRSW